MRKQRPITSFEHGMFVRDRDATNRRGSLLYIHGLGESGLCFEHLLDHPGLKEWRQLVPDLPGYGRSPRCEEPMTLTDQADCLANWLRNSKVDCDATPVIVIGHSMGGVTGLLFCERHPDLTVGLVDVEGNKSRNDCVFSGHAAKQNLGNFLAGGFDQMRDAVFHEGQEDVAKRGYYVSLRLADPRAFYLNSQELIKMSEQEDMAKRLASLPIPSYYIAGVPDGVSERSRQLLVEAGVAWIGIEPSGHWPFIDQTERFVQELLKILNS
jgi:pimeloyl-ACP methyl ester carboxylesterase